MLLFLRIATDTEINKGWKLEVDIDIDIDIDIDQDSVHLALPGASWVTDF
jgi:hypothetical protein